MSPTALEIVALALAGLAVGSFLNVVAWRLPRGESIVRPRSRCPSCGTQIASHDNIPVVSWLLLRGRCRHCGESISLRYPAIELATGLLYVGVAVQEGADLAVLPGIALMTMLVLVTATDLEHRIVPNQVVAVGAVAAVVLWAVADVSRLPENLLAGAIAGGVFFAISSLALLILGREGLGMGDVKLAGAMGLYLGASIAPALFVACAAGALLGLVLAFAAGHRGVDRRRYALPFVPYMAFGGVIAWFWGAELIDWYLGTSGLG
jgi:leader peptidase (prepilin peptidase)/N-methyltransferase